MKRSHSGNAVVFILIGIALFGALAAMITRSAKVGQGNLTTQQSKLGAQEILSYSQDIERVLDKLRQKGCSEQDFDFTNSVWVNRGGTIIHPAGYNLQADTANCGVFTETGGPAIARSLEKRYFPSSDLPTGATEYGSYKASKVRIPGVGTNSIDLVLFLPRINNDICMEINTRLGVSNNGISPPTCTMTGSADRYNGSMASGDSITDDNGLITGKTGFCCIYEPAQTAYFHVLISR